MEIFSIKPENFGMEISDSAIRIARLKKARRFHAGGKFFNLVSWGENKIEEGMVKEGEIRDRASLIESIKKSLKDIKGEKIRGKQIIFSLPESKAFLQPIKMPRMTEIELQSAILFEAENYIPLSAEEVYLDFQVAGSTNLTQEVLIAAFPKTIADSYLALFKEVGLSPAVFEPESMAVCRALIPHTITKTSQFGVGVLDLGEAKANFIIFSEGAIRFTSSFPLPGQDFSLLANQINRYIEYCFSHHLIKKKVEEILLSGEGEDLEKLAEFFSRELKIQTKLGNPWINILPEGKKPPLSQKESLRYATCLGLAMRSLKSEI